MLWGISVGLELGDRGEDTVGGLENAEVLAFSDAGLVADTLGFAGRGARIFD